MDKKLPDKIKRIDVLRVEYGKGKLCNCFEPHYEIDYQNKMVYCLDCGAIVEPFEALYKIARDYSHLGDQVEALLQQRREIANYKPHMVVFRDLEKSYRKRKSGKMLPRCPKCGEAFYFEHITCWVNEAFNSPKHQE